MNRASLLLLCALLTHAAHAATSTAWELSSYQDFLRGRLNGLSLTNDGRLTLGLRIEPLFDTSQPAVWSVARASDGTLYLGTGHRGRVYRVDSSGRGSLVWTAPQPEVFALAADTKGAVYAASSPSGKIFRIDGAEPVEYFAPGARYIWAMAVAADGALMVATGDEGKIFRVAGPGRGELYYETGQPNVTALSFDREGRLIAGTEPNGILYRVESRGKAFVLYDANLPEIRSITLMNSGALAVAAMGGSLARRTGAGSGSSTTTSTPQVTAPPTSITVTDAQTVLPVKPQPDAAKPPAASSTASVTPAFEYSGVERSAIYLIHPDHTVETMWTSKEENVYDITTALGSLMFATDTQGRIYRLSERKVDLAGQTGEGETTRLIASPNGLIATTSNAGKSFRLGSGREAKGSFESPVHDANTVARWGRLNWRAHLPAGSKLSFQTRTGNTARPDSTWSEWSGAISDPDKSSIASPNARYIQWKADLSGTGNSEASVESVSVAYLPQNTPPVIRSIHVSSQSQAPAAAKSGSGAAAPAPAASFSITVTESGEAPPAAGTPTQTLGRSGSGQIQVAWQADDSDADKLLFSLYFRGEGEQEWKLLRAGISENTYTLEADVLADGRYWFKVSATDRPSNPANLARDAELVSSTVLVDNTPPIVRPGAPRKTESGWEIDIDAEDAASPLRKIEYSVDAGPWTPLEAMDGVTDSGRERYQARIDGLRPGEHLIVLRAFDSAGNAGVAKVVLR